MPESPRREIYPNWVDIWISYVSLSVLSYAASGRDRDEFTLWGKFAALTTAQSLKSKLPGGSKSDKLNRALVFRSRIAKDGNTNVIFPAGRRQGRGKNGV
jgi:hypothetical protein